MISKRMLTKWRREALRHQENLSLLTETHNEEESDNALNLIIDAKLYNDKILQMTQELLDQHLLKEKR